MELSLKDRIGLIDIAVIDEVVNRTTISFCKSPVKIKKLNYDQ